MHASIRSAADLGAFVRRIRLQNNLTQGELARALGSSQRYVSELEAGKPKRADDNYFDFLAKLGIGLTAEAAEANPAPERPSKAGDVSSAR
ncbi:helix-turn-helix domain-containing protein [Subtercola frigoramans]|uniref:Transcriptional regulator with XRE-family HTH domain n=1 Tax=Subtercola frigoramans TaxID=120298 RepID=A0ABS2L8Y9_9MICO|nr:helix-turn-helix domain-containing protein [Subtercola frigoramans]MBM7473561.1 transcriptional regulator with XRE-family HTH domain [Subtercola frigoramans]